MRKKKKKEKVWLTMRLGFGVQGIVPPNVSSAPGVLGTDGVFQPLLGMGKVTLVREKNRIKKEDGSSGEKNAAAYRHQCGESPRKGKNRDAWAILETKISLGVNVDQKNSHFS